MERDRQSSSYEPWETFGEGEKYIDGVSKQIGELTKQYFTQFIRHDLSREDVEQKLSAEIRTALNLLVPPSRE
jgi:hypothetical protein